MGVVGQIFCGWWGMGHVYFIANIYHDELHLPADGLPTRSFVLMQDSKNPQQVRYPEDIQIIIRSDTHAHGNLFLGNLEAAQNPQLLQSTPQFTQNSKSLQ